MKCQFCDESNHDQGVSALRDLFAAITDTEETDEALNDKAHRAWRDFRKAESISIPNDKQLLDTWLDGLR